MFDLKIQKKILLTILEIIFRNRCPDQELTPKIEEEKWD